MRKLNYLPNSWWEQNGTPLVSDLNPLYIIIV